MSDPSISRFKVKTDRLAAVLVTLAPLIYFLPALCNGLVITPDDGMLQNVPFKIAAAKILWSGQFPMWNPYLFGGMPLLGASQGGLLFPLNWLYVILSPAAATNLMVLLTYMFAALGAYLFARRTGASVTGAAVTSIVWSQGGFLVNQISHINIVQTAALLPWALWAMEHYVRTGLRKHGALLAIIIALQIFAGHQQTFAYVFLLLIAYAIVMSIDGKRLNKRYLVSLTYCLVGVLLGAIQILPTWELLRNSVRATASYDFFTSFSMPKLSVMTFLAPFVFGGGDGRIFKAPYIGQSFYTEYVPYAGVIAIMLALMALRFRADRQTKFWTCVVGVGLLLAFGRNAPLSFNRLVYFIPVLNLFRVPARHLMEVHFAVAILAGRGLSWQAKESRPAASRVILISGLVILLTVLVVTWWRPENFHLAREVPLSILRAPELFMPIVFAFVSSLALWFLARGRRGAVALVLLVLFADLFVWGQFNGWYASSRRIPAEYWTVPESVSLLKSRATDPRYRILTTHLPFEPKSPVPADDNGWVIWTEPDIYMMHGIQNVAGYDGFGLQRYSELAGQMKLWGALTDPNATLRSNSRELDVLSTRYVIARHERPSELKEEAQPTSAASSFPAATEKYGNLSFAANDLSLPALAANKRLSFTCEPVTIDQVALVTNLSFAEEIPDTTIVARLHLKTSDGELFEFQIRAGEHSADWAYDRPDIRRRIKHKRANVATSYDVHDSSFSYQGHTYVSSFKLPARLAVASGNIEVDSQIQSATLSVFRISLIDSSEMKSYPLTKSMIAVAGTSAASNETNDNERWKLIARGLDVNIYENARALPQAWMASEIRVLDDQGTLQTIRTGVLPDGSRWDPLRTALVAPGNEITQLQASGNVGFTRYRANSIKLKTDTTGTSLLVVSENDYPGWKAYVAGNAAPIVRVNYYLRGVVVPAGQHEVSFYYRPLSVLVGAVLTLLTAAGLILFCWVLVPRSKDLTPKINN